MVSVLVSFFFGCNFFHKKPSCQIDHGTMAQSTNEKLRSRAFATLITIVFLFVPYLGFLSHYSVQEAQVPILTFTAPQNKSLLVRSEHDEKIVVVVRLQGELGNNLCKISYGKALQLLLRDRHGMSNTRLALRPQRDNRKAQFVNQLLRMCFEWTQQIDFNETYSGYLPRKIREAKKIGALNFDGDIAHRPKDLLKQLDDAVQTWRTNQSAPRILWADGYLNPPNSFMLHHYQQELMETTFALSPSCCGGATEMPYDDEIVFHLRSFVQEILPHKARHSHWHEANPKTMSTKILSNLTVNKGERVALVGPPTANRFKALAAQGRKHAMAEHDEELQKHGVRTRVISSNNVLDDFCFLVNTKKQLIGARQSTFVTWASYIGNANQTQPYAIGDRDTEHIHSWADTPSDYQPDPLLEKRYHQRVFQQVSD